MMPLNVDQISLVVAGCSLCYLSLRDQSVNPLKLGVPRDENKLKATIKQLDTYEKRGQVTAMERLEKATGVRCVESLPSEQTQTKIPQYRYPNVVRRSGTQSSFRFSVTFRITAAHETRSAALMWGFIDCRASVFHELDFGLIDGHAVDPMHNLLLGEWQSNTIACLLCSIRPSK